MKVVAIVQARMGSTRLPAKVMQELAGEPMLARVVRRLRRATSLHEVVVATTTAQADAAIVELCNTRGWLCYRGSEEDVLDRYYKAAVAFRADAIVRVTSDCPLIEPAIVDTVVEKFLAHQPDVDYVSNALPRRTFPRGLDTEVFSYAALGRAWNEDKEPSTREHVTPYIWKHGESFRVSGLTVDVNYSQLRWTVDTLEDLTFVRGVYEHFGHDYFSWHEVLTLLEKHPEWVVINQHVAQKIVP